MPWGLLKRLGWVETTGQREASQPQDYDPNFRLQTYYRMAINMLRPGPPQN